MRVMYFLLMVIMSIPTYTTGNSYHYSSPDISFLESGREPKSKELKRITTKKKAPKNSTTKTINTLEMLFFFLSITVAAAGVLFIMLSLITPFWWLGLGLWIAAFNLLAAYFIVHSLPNSESVLTFVPTLLLGLFFLVFGLVLLIGGLVLKELKIWLPGLILLGVMLLVILFFLIFVASIRRQ